MILPAVSTVSVESLVPILFKSEPTLIDCPSETGALVIASCLFAPSASTAVYKSLASFSRVLNRPNSAYEDIIIYKL
jgi:hypothetical protein